MTYILFAALAPVGMLLYYIYRKDEYQQEPVAEILKAFGLGVFSVFVSKRLSDVGYLRVIYICISSVLIFYISSLFINGLMLK
jgi:RsiW-degrading membrane proteinase PrsW (M82 family)